MLNAKIVSLLTLIDCGSYTKAARQLHLTQPATSHRVKQLEEEFRAKIFHRSKKSFILTPEGEALVKYVYRMTAVYNNIHQASEDTKNHLHRFNIVTIPTAGEYYIPQFLTACRREHNDVHIDLITDSISSIYNKLELYEADLTIVDGRLTPDEYHSALLDTGYLRSVASPQHPLVNHSNASMNELLKESFILRSKEAGTREISEGYLEPQHDSTRNYRILVEADSLATIKGLVVSNMGVSIMPHNVCREDGQKGQSKTISITNSTMIQEINLVCPKDFQHVNVLLELKRAYSKLR